MWVKAEDYDWTIFSKEEGWKTAEEVADLYNGVLEENRKLRAELLRKDKLLKRAFIYLLTGIHLKDGQL